MTQDDWQAMREIRLQALQDAPDAFASTATAERQPLPSNPDLGEFGMGRPL